jgi:hypothetical protein
VTVVEYVLPDGTTLDRDRAIEYAEERLGRPLTDGEKALDLVGLDVDLREGKERLAAAIEDEKRRAIAEAARGGPGRLRVTPEIVAAMDALVDAGRRHAREEIRTLTGRELSDREYEEVGGRLRRFLATLTEALTAIGVRIAGALDAAEFRASNEITEQLLEKLDREIPGARDVASRLASGLMFGGLGEVYEANADLFPCFTYSAVMDSATCGPCRDTDGRRYDTWADGEVDLPGGGPNPRCLGDGRCRCRLVPCPPGDLVDETVPEPPAPLDDTPLQRDVREFRDNWSISHDEVEALFRGTGPETENVFGIDGYASRDLQAREGRLRLLGSRVWEDAERRANERLADRDRQVAALDERVNAIRDRHADVLNRASEARARVEERLLAGRLAWELSDDEWDHLQIEVAHDPEVLALEPEETEILDLLVAASREREAIGANVVEVLRESILDALRDLGVEFDREVAIEPPTDQMLRAVRDHPDDGWSASPTARENAETAVRWASKLLPADWIEASDNDPIRGGPVRVLARSRGVHHQATRLLGISFDSHPTPGMPNGGSTALHELGHRMEWAIPEIRVWQWIFHSRRTVKSQDPLDRLRRRLAEIQPGHGYRDDEWTYDDHFADPYIGKDYGTDPNSAYEILTMGLEGLLTGDNHVLSALPSNRALGRGDDEHRDFILGLLATVRPTPAPLPEIPDLNPTPG